MKREHFPELSQFFGCYFHQDWRLEAPDWESVVKNFLRENPADFISGVTEELGRLLEMNLDREEMRAALDKLGSAYSPGPEMSDQEW
ncbi:MAG TPA: contact-dependent growth inhibition system immunity protein, partial [Myxococcaceae bacterium]